MSGKAWVAGKDDTLQQFEARRGEASARFGPIGEISVALVLLVSLVPFVLLVSLVSLVSLVLLVSLVSLGPLALLVSLVSLVPFVL
jgi:hypothetical protein